jgi:hypothetical protein
MISDHIKDIQENKTYKMSCSPGFPSSKAGEDIDLWPGREKQLICLSLITISEE